MTPHGDAPAAPVRPFYARVVDEAELREATDLQGVDQELALLRVKLREQIDANPKDLALMLKSVDSIVRAVSARYRMSAKRTDDLANALRAVGDAVSSQFM